MLDLITSFILLFLVANLSLAKPEIDPLWTKCEKDNECIYTPSDPCHLRDFVINKKFLPNYEKQHLSQHGDEFCVSSDKVVTPKPRLVCHRDVCVELK